MTAYHPTFRVQALFLCWLLATWYVKNEVAESQISSCFPLDRHATTNFGHYMEHWNVGHWTAWFILGRQGTLTGWTQGKIFSHNFYIPSLNSAVACPCISQSSHGPSIFSKLAWHLYIFKAHMAHIKFRLTKSWTFKSGSPPPSFSLLLPADCLNTRFLGVPRLCAVSDHPLYIFVYLCVNYTLWRLGASIVGANCRFFRYSPLKLITLQSRIISIIGIYLKRPFLFFAGCRQLFLQ